MSNILNSHIANNNNVVAANPLKQKKEKTKPIVAPVKLPEYSIHKELKDKDEFRKSVLIDLGKADKRRKKTKNFIKTLLLVIATVASYKYFKGKV